MYAPRSKVVFRVENPLVSIAMRVYALKTTLLTLAKWSNPCLIIEPVIS